MWSTLLWQHTITYCEHTIMVCVPIVAYSLHKSSEKICNHCRDSDPLSHWLFTRFYNKHRGENITVPIMIININFIQWDFLWIINAQTATSQDCDVGAVAVIPCEYPADIPWNNYPYKYVCHFNKSYFTTSCENVLVQRITGEELLMVSNFRKSHVLSSPGSSVFSARIYINIKGHWNWVSLAEGFKLWHDFWVNAL